MLTIWGRATSSNVQKVMWTVGELGLAHKRIDVGGHFGGLDTPQYRTMNPPGLVPTLELEDGRALFESNAIVRFLARQDPERRMWPVAMEADVDVWAEWAHNAVHRTVTALFWAIVRTRPEERDHAAIAKTIETAAKALEIADARLANHPFLMGDTLTIADVQFAHILYRYYTMPMERPAQPGIEAYYKRVSARPAYAEHVMVDYSSLYAKA